MRSKFLPPYKIANIGIAVPSAYEKVIITAVPVTVPVRANATTEAKIGPTQGVHKSPIERPMRKPEPNPVFPCVLGVNAESLEKSSSMSV